MISFPSIKTISNPEFINVEPLDLNPMMSRCQIKVFYLGKNRNQTAIDKSAAMKIAKTLRGAPIVGYYKGGIGDFRDHGETVKMDYDEFKIEEKTFPYGFVSPDSKVWFQKYIEPNNEGSQVEREYLVCEGYLWTGQYPECQSVINEGKPHSMKLDNETVQGEWTKDLKTNSEFFIINDATIYNLCILGDDVEPCFEGSSIVATSSPAQSYSLKDTKEEITSAVFSIDKDFKCSLYKMMQDLKFALQGGKTMENEILEQNTEPTTTISEPENAVVEPTETFKKKDDDEENNNPAPTTEEEPKKGEDEAEKKYTELEAQFSALTDKYSLMENELKELRTFKANVEDKEKDALIGNFYMLSDEDKADVISNKSQYTLDEIEQKLSVLCFRKKVNFNLNDNEEIHNKTEEQNISTFSLNQTDTCPAWIKAVKQTRDAVEDI